MTVMAKAPDRWHRWLTDVRFGGDPAARERLLTELLYPVRDRVLDKAELQPGGTVLDVGTGDGLIAFGALERLGPSGQVIFSDISQDLLDHCRAAAAAEGLLDRCRFVLASADSLADIADASVDVVTTRSVLIYVKDKAETLQEFYRVLRPGGRISVFEPINVLMRDPDRLLGYDMTPVKPLVAKLRAFYESLQPPGVDPMIDFDERDLLRHAEQAGFADINLELRATGKTGKRPVPGNEPCACRETRSCRRWARSWTGRSARRRSPSSPRMSSRWSSLAPGGSGRHSPTWLPPRTSATAHQAATERARFPASARAQRHDLAGPRRATASVDVELIALGVLHP